MSAAADMAPETARSLRGAEIQEAPPHVELQSADDLPAWVHPISTSAPLIRVARWMQHATKGDIDLGPGATSTHVALMFAVGQYQGQNDYSTAGQRTLATAAWTVERAARMGLEELVANGWLTRANDPPGSVARYAVAVAPGRPIPLRRTHKRPTSAVNADPPEEVAGASPGDGAAISAGPPGNKIQTPRQSVPDPPAINADKKTKEEITEEITEKTFAGVPAGARTCEATSMPSPSPQANLFGEPVCEPAPSPKPKPAKAAKAQKPPKPAPAPKAAKLYSAAYVAGMADAEPGCGFTPLTEAACGLIGMAAAAHAKDAATGEPITGEPLLAWIRKTAAEYRRAADPAFAKGFDAHSFLTWLNASRPKTRKVPLPPPPEPPRSPIVIPPPVPIPEMFQAMARADAEAGRVHPLVQHFENLRKSKET